MKQQTEFEDACEVEDVPVSPLLAEERKNRYGSVPGLDDEELADPCELERAVVLEMWGPVLALPVRKKGAWIRPNVDEDGSLDFGAFGTVDFGRNMPEFDKIKYKADRLQDELRDELILVAIIRDRLPRARSQVLKYLDKGTIQLEHIQNQDMLEFAKLLLRARRIQKEIASLRKASWERRQARLPEVFI